MASKSSWTPDWAVPPGDILLEALEERDLSQSELARRMDRPVKTINEIVKGKAAITPATAIQLERALGIEAGLWIGLESKYREALARAADAADLRAHSSFLKRFPVKDLVQQGVLGEDADPAERLGQLLAFFGVSSTSAWLRSWAVAPALRESSAYSSSQEAIATWIRLGQVRAERVKVGTYEAAAFRELLSSVRTWTRQEPFATVVGKLVSKCAEVGVALVLVPEVQGTHVSGAAHQTDRGTRVVQLSGRYKRDDQFWFSFFHEAGHILMTPGRLVIDGANIEDVVRGDRGTDEELVDGFARDLLLPRQLVDEFVAEHPQPTEADVRFFARSSAVSPGIVVGRLQRDGIIGPAKLNHLKKRVDVAW